MGAPLQAGFLRQLSDLPLSPAPQLAMELRGEAVEAVTRGLGRVSLDTKGKAYVGATPCCPVVVFVLILSPVAPHGFNSVLTLIP